MLRSPSSVFLHVFYRHLSKFQTNRSPPPPFHFISLPPPPPLPPSLSTQRSPRHPARSVQSGLLPRRQSRSHHLRTAYTFTSSAPSDQHRLNQRRLNQRRLTQRRPAPSQPVPTSAARPGPSQRRLNQHRLNQHPPSTARPAPSSTDQRRLSRPRIPVVPALRIHYIDMPFDRGGALSERRIAALHHLRRTDNQLLWINTGPVGR